MDLSRLVFRPVQDDDVDSIVDLLKPYVVREIVLPREPDEIREHSGNFIVVSEGDSGNPIGAVALRDFGGGLSEIRSLVVHVDHTGNRIGTMLVRKVLALAEQRGATRVFALTLRPGLFLRLGFHSVDKSVFPEKVWSDCVNCPKLHRCDEIAVLKSDDS